MVEAIFVWIPINLIIGAIIGNTKGRVGEAIMLALLLGPIGWLCVLLGPDNRRKCPYCAEAVKPEAKICPHCRKDLGGIEYMQWKAKRDSQKLATVEDPVEKWAKEHPDEAARE